jgi:hypothetical protein
MKKIGLNIKLLFAYFLEKVTFFSEIKLHKSEGNNESFFLAVFLDNYMANPGRC